MNKTNNSIQRPAALEALADQVRKTLSEQEKYVFDQYWFNGPQPSADLLPEKSKENAQAAAHKTRAKLERFFESPAGMQNAHRLTLTDGNARYRNIEVEKNLLPGATAFWLAHLCDGRRPGLVLSEQSPIRKNAFKRCTASNFF